MKTSLDHLPPARQRELERVVRILFEEFTDATAIATSDWKKQARILKVILYGSYARGGWVDEPHTAKGHQSGFDLPIIVNHKKLTDRVEFWSSADAPPIYAATCAKCCDDGQANKPPGYFH